MKWIEDSPEWQRQRAAEPDANAATLGVSVYRRLYRLLRRLPEPAPAPGLVDAVGLCLRAEARRQWRRRWVWRGLTMLAMGSLWLLVVPLLRPVLMVLSTRMPSLPWPLLLAATVALLVGAGIGRAMQVRRERR